MFSFHLLLSWILEELLAFQRLQEFRFMLSWSLYYYLSKKETNHFNASDYRWLWSGALSCCSRINSGSYYCKQQFAWTMLQFYPIKCNQNQGCCHWGSLAHHYQQSHLCLIVRLFSIHVFLPKNWIKVW